MNRQVIQVMTNQVFNFQVLSFNLSLVKLQVISKSQLLDSTSLAFGLQHTEAVMLRSSIFGVRNFPDELSNFQPPSVPGAWRQNWTKTWLTVTNWCLFGRCTHKWTLSVAPSVHSKLYRGVKRTHELIYAIILSILLHFVNWKRI